MRHTHAETMTWELAYVDPALEVVTQCIAGGFCALLTIVFGCMTQSSATVLDICSFVVHLLLQWRVAVLHAVHSLNSAKFHKSLL